MLAKRFSRAVAVVAAIGLCALAPGSPSAGAAAASVRVTASCAFPSMDPVVVPTDVSVQLPDTATTVQPVALNAFSVGVTIPEATVAALRAAGTTSIGAGFTVALTGTWQQQSHDIEVPALTAPDNPLPDTGDLHVTATTDVPPVPIDTPGDVTFAMPQVITTLTLHSGDTATDAPCTEDPGQNGTIGSVTVTGPPTHSGPNLPSANPSSAPGTSTTTETSGSSGSAKPSPRNTKPALAAGGPAPGDLPDTFDGICDPKAPGTLPNPVPVRYKIGGKITVKKLGSDLTVPMGELRGDMYLHLSGPGGYYACIDATATVPDAPGYFTMFNFVPASASVHVAPSHTRAKIGGGYLTSLTKAPTSMHHVTVNGTPLDVSPDCRTAEDATIKLAGPFQSFTSSGTVPGVVTMPPFVGCHDGGDPSTPIFTGLVSGPDNPALMDLIYICYANACNGIP